MNKFKDLIYDKNDLFIALLILLCAGLVIFSKINLIMDYPATLSAAEASSSKQSAVQYTGDTKSEETDAQNETETAEQAPTGDTGEPADSNPQTETEEAPNGSSITVTIDYGATGSDIAQVLVDAGLLDTRQQFYDAVNQAGADTRLQAGTFEIPAGSSPDEIISIITE